MSASRETISLPQLQRCQSKKRLCLQCKSYQYNQRIVQRGLSEAHNGYGLCMIPGYWPHDAQFSSLVLDGSPGCKLSTALEHENCASWGPCAMGRGVNPTFHSQMSTPDHPQHQITWFLVFWCSCNKQTSLQKRTGVIRPSG